MSETFGETVDHFHSVGELLQAPILSELGHLLVEFFVEVGVELVSEDDACVAGPSVGFDDLGDAVADELVVLGHKHTKDIKVYGM